MDWSQPGAQIFIPDRASPEEALNRTTHMGIGAHPDDLEFMAWHGILECFMKPDRWFTGITVTDGRGSSRANEYADYSDADMRSVRLEEQKQAASIGHYSALAWLDYRSGDIGKPDLHKDLVQLLKACRPQVLYTHNLADKHNTHIALALAVLKACRALPPEERPQTLIGCEVWRGLDWMPDELKLTFNVSAHENLTMALMGVYDSQIAGGKRYDLATQGRKRANATYHASHVSDKASLLEFAMDMTPLLHDDSLAPEQFVDGLVQSFARDVQERIARCTS